ncbi:hypothetical protein [Rothia sp. CCM 9416]|uniref:hypothetical protein n=1 Tax=Rothia sp. CCM 9416 TaxID=3402655 RepID=UPI003AEB64B9
MDQELYFDLLKRVIAAEKRIENLEQALEHRAGANPEIATQKPAKISTRQIALNFVAEQVGTRFPQFHLVGSASQGKNRLQIVNGYGETKNILLASSRNHARSVKVEFESWNTVSASALEDNEFFILSAEGGEDDPHVFIFSQEQMRNLCSLKMPDHENKFRFKIVRDRAGVFWDQNPQDIPTEPIDITWAYTKWDTLAWI